MADVTKCSSIDCPVRKQCYRYMSKPSVKQIYSNFEYECNENTGFCNFINMKGDEYYATRYYYP